MILFNLVWWEFLTIRYSKACWSIVIFHREIGVKVLRAGSDVLSAIRIISTSLQGFQIWLDLGIPCGQSKGQEGRE